MGRLLGAGAVSLAVLCSFGSAAPAAAPQAVFPFVVTFASAPIPVDTWNAPWTLNAATPAASVAWTLETTGGASDASGDAGYWRAVRNAEGSSVQVLQYPVPSSTSLYLGVWIRCPDYDPSPGSNYWVEAGAIAGTPSLPVTVGSTTISTIGQHYDDPATGGAWSVFKKFDGASGSGPNHDNGNVWTWYYSTTPLNTGSNTVINIGFKIGSLYNTTTYQPPAYAPPTNVLDVGYDGLSVSTSMMSSPPATFNPPPAGGSGGGSGSSGGGGGSPGSGVSGGGSGHSSQNLAHRCGCSSIPAGRRGRLWTIAALALLPFLLRKRR